MRSVAILLLLLLPIPVRAVSINRKTIGKIGFALVLTGVAIGIKYLHHRDRVDLQQKRQALMLSIAREGIEKKVARFNRGFDHWCIEYYGPTRIQLRDGVLQTTRREKLTDGLSP